MAPHASIRSGQILRARQMLRDLPEKEDKKTRAEAAALLENDFRKAMQKGYKPREVRQLLGNEGIIIPEYLIKRYFNESGDAPGPKRSEKASVKQEASAETSAARSLAASRMLDDKF